jgi:hypothetical protein
MSFRVMNLMVDVTAPRFAAFGCPNSGPTTGDIDGCPNSGPPPTPDGCPNSGITGDVGCPNSGPTTGEDQGGCPNSGVTGGKRKASAWSGLPDLRRQLRETLAAQV